MKTSEISKPKDEDFRNIKPKDEDFSKRKHQEQEVKIKWHF
jgi:hypothetical protein